MDGSSLPQIVSPIPGPRSVAFVERLARTECPAITARRARRADESGVSQDPIVWTEARGANVKDVDGNVYVDFTSAFGVSGLGHGHPRVVEAAHRQVDRLIHAMGDVYPADVKIELCDRLAELAPGSLQRSILGLSGASSVESALKTAAVHTGKPGVVAFVGGYHGLSIGALAVQGYAARFRKPFEAMLNRHAVLCELDLAAVEAALETSAVGAVVVEPIQARGGVVEPPDGFLGGLRALCDAHDVVLVFDEVYTGFARTGDLFACERDGVIPDVLVVGKAMGGGFPISAAIGTPEVMDSWGASQGEAIHTQTFLGNPLGCAMALAALDALVDEDWVPRVRERGASVRARLEGCGFVVRGRGLMLGVELADANASLAVMSECLRAGYLVLPCGMRGEVLGITPPFVVSDAQVDGFIACLQKAVEKAGSAG